IVLPVLMAAGDLQRSRASDRPTKPSRALAISYVTCLAVLLIWLPLRAAALPDAADAGLSDSPLAGTSLTVRWLTALQVIGRYALLLCVRVILSADYSYDQIPLVNSVGDPGALLGAVVLISLAAVALRVMRGAPAGTIGIALLATFAPVSNLLLPIG